MACGELSLESDSLEEAPAQEIYIGMTYILDHYFLLP